MNNQPAAFEIAKGPRRVMTLSEAEVARLLDLSLIHI